MTIRDLLTDKGLSLAKSIGVDRSKLSEREKGKANSGEGLLETIRGAARKATAEFIKSRRAAEKEIAGRRKAAEKKAVRSAAGEKTAGEESVGIAAGEEAARKANDEEADRIAAEEKAARKAAKKQRAAEETAQWVAESIRALGDSVELNDEDAVTAARSICDTLDWKFLKNLTGCQIEYGIDEDFSDSRREKIRKSDDLGELDKNLEAGKTYYVRFRLCASVKNKKHCSDWSEVMTLKS